MKNKYQVIGNPAHWAIIDFGLSLAKAQCALNPATFSNGLPALGWLYGFPTRHRAEAFADRCRSALAFQAGRLGRWITPEFVVTR